MTIQAGVLPELQIGVETAWPLKREGKQVYAKLIDFGGLPAPYGLKGKTHGVYDIEWGQISWDHSYVASSTDSRRRSLALVSTPATSGGNMPWRFQVDSTNVQVNILTNTDYREWDTIVLCLLYTKTGDGAESGSLVAPGPDGLVLTSRDNELVWEESAPSEPFERYDLCEFYYFRQPRLRPGFQPANGMLLENAAELYPRAWEYLLSDEGQELCVSEDEWQAMTRAIWATLPNGKELGWEGIGGVPFYAMHLNTGALRLPDLRGMYPEVAGFDGLGVGGVHGDGMRNILGSIELSAYINSTNSTNPIGAWLNPSGVLAGTAIDSEGSAFNTVTATNGSTKVRRLTINSSRSLPTANKNQPRAWGALGCVYLGAPR